MCSSVQFREADSGLCSQLRPMPRPGRKYTAPSGKLIHKHDISVSVKVLSVFPVVLCWMVTNHRSHYVVLCVVVSYVLCLFYLLCFV